MSLCRRVEVMPASKYVDPAGFLHVTEDKFGTYGHRRNLSQILKHKAIHIMHGSILTGNCSINSITASLTILFRILFTSDKLICVAT